MAKKAAIEIDITDLEQEINVKEVMAEIEESKIKPVTNEEIFESFEYLMDQLKRLELYKRSIKKPFKIAFYLRNQTEILYNSFKRSTK